MKRTFLLLLIISFTSCGNLTKPKITDEVFEPTIDSLYTQCRDLKGLGKLHIGSTTLWQAKRDKGITISGYSRTPSFVGGYWGANILYDGFDMGEYLNKKATTIKQWEITDIANKYQIGTLEIEDVCLAFYRDTLVAISFECSDEMLKHYISKYGNGKGRKYDYFYSRGKYGEKGYFSEHKRIENRTWMNKYVTMEYKYSSVYRTSTSQRRGEISSSKSCVISSNRRYNDFINTLEKHKTNFKNQKKKKKENSFNSL